MAREPHTQGRVAAWRTEIDGFPHTIELEIGYSADSWLIWLDGRLVSSLNDKVHGRFEFRIGSHDCVIKERGRSFTLHIDGWRIPRIDQGADLLRPASRPADSASLLRPAKGTGSSGEALLRPQNLEEEA